MSDNFEVDPFLIFSKENFEKVEEKFRLLPLSTRRTHKKTLVLDLDETLIHSSLTPVNDPDDIVFTGKLPNVFKFFVKYRPGLLEFLRKVSMKFELVVYTASSREYAEKVLGKIDPRRKLLKYRLYREDCLLMCGHYLKDISRLGRDLAQVVIMDNSVAAFAMHLDNGIPISTWIEDVNDIELSKAEAILQHVKECPDVRPFLKSFFNLTQVMKETQENYRKNQENGTVF